MRTPTYENTTNSICINLHYKQPQWKICMWVIFEMMLTLNHVVRWNQDCWILFQTLNKKDESSFPIYKWGEISSAPRTIDSCRQNKQLEKRKTPQKDNLRFFPTKLQGWFEMIFFKKLIFYLCSVFCQYQFPPPLEQSKLQKCQEVK